MPDDARRVDPTSVFAKTAASVVGEVNEIKQRDLAMIDFLSIQSRDGAVNHNEAVAAYALALLRHLKTEGADTPGLDAVAEDALVRTALLHDVGKHDQEGARLNDPTPAERERAALRQALPLCCPASSPAPVLPRVKPRAGAFSNTRGAYVKVTIQLKVVY